MSVATLRKLDQFDIVTHGTVIVCDNTPGFMRVGSLVGHQVRIDDRLYDVRGSESDLIPNPHHVQRHLGLLVSEVSP